MLVVPLRADGPRQHPHPVAEDELAALPAGDEQADHSRSRKNEKRAAWPRLSLPASRRPERQAPPDQGGAEGPVPVVADRDMTGSVMGDRAERVEAGRAATVPAAPIQRFQRAATRHLPDQDREGKIAATNNSPAAVTNSPIVK